MDFRHKADKMLDDSEERLHTTFDSHRQHFRASLVTDRKDRAFTSCAESHNQYILEINATNSLIKIYHTQSLPWALEELENLHKDTANAVTATVQNLALLTVSKARDQAHRYDSVFSVCKQVNPENDLQKFVRSVRPGIEADSQNSTKSEIRKHVFQPVLKHSSTPPCLLKSELIFDHFVEDQIKNKKRVLISNNMELQRHISDAENDIVSLTSQLTKQLSGANNSDVYETQVTICKKTKELNLAKLRLCVAQSQLASLKHKTVTINDLNTQISTASTSSKSIRSMWKRFAKKASSATKKETGGNNSKEPAINITLSTGEDNAQKLSCSNSDPIYNLLKSASSLSKKNSNPLEGDNPINLNVLPRQNTTSSTQSGNSRSSSPGSAVILAPQSATSSNTSARPKQLLNHRMKSFSLDTADGPKPVDQTTRVKSNSYTNNACIPGTEGGSGTATRRMRMMQENRGLSADLDDQRSSERSDNLNSKPLIRPIPMERKSLRLKSDERRNLSEMRQDDRTGQKPNRSPKQDNRSPKQVNRLEKPDNRGGYGEPIIHFAPISLGGSDLYLAIYDYNAQEPGDLTFRVGDCVTVHDTSDPDWWFGATRGDTGYFPSKYMMPMMEGKRVHKVIKSLQLGGGDKSGIRLVRDQAVVETRRESADVITIQAKDINNGRLYEMTCPQRYLTPLG